MHKKLCCPQISKYYDIFSEIYNKQLRKLVKI